MILYYHLSDLLSGLLCDLSRGLQRLILTRSRARNESSDGIPGKCRRHRDRVSPAS